MSKIIITNPRLALETTTILLKTMPAIKAAASGKQGLVLDQEAIFRVNALIEAYQGHASKQLAKDLDWVKRTVKMLCLK